MYYTRTVWSRRAQCLVFGACLVAVATGWIGTLQARQDMPAPLSPLTASSYLRVERFSSPADSAIELRFFLKPSSNDQGERVVTVTQQSLRLFGDWFGPFPYPELIVVDAPWNSPLAGAAFPHAVVTGTRWLAIERDGSVDRSLIAAIAREYWLGGSSASEVPPFDEGLALFAASRAIDVVLQGRQYWSRRYLGGFVPYAVRSLPLSPPRSAAQGRSASFDELQGSHDAVRTMTALQTLERYIGWSALQQGLAAYREQFPHGGGSAQHLLAILNEQGGRDLSRFFAAAFNPATTFDYGVGYFATVSAGDRQLVRVSLRQNGPGEFPVSYELRFADGSRVHDVWPAGKTSVELEYSATSPLVSVQVDPESALLLDADRTNNSRNVSRPQLPRIFLRGLASWMVWLQDLMLTSSALS